MVAIINAAGFCLLKWLITSLFSLAHTEHMKTQAVEPKAVRILVGFRSLQGSNTRSESRGDQDKTALIQLKHRQKCVSGHWLHQVVGFSSYNDMTPIRLFTYKSDRDSKNNIIACELECITFFRYYLDVFVRNNSTSFEMAQKHIPVKNCVMFTDVMIAERKKRNLSINSFIIFIFYLLLYLFIITINWLLQSASGWSIKQSKLLQLNSKLNIFGLAKTRKL